MDVSPRLRAAAVSVSISVLVLDRLTKHLIEDYFLSPLATGGMVRPSVPLLGDALRLTYVRNPGMVFGLFSQSDSAYRTPIVAGLSIVAIVLLVVTFVKLESARRSTPFGLALVLGGAIGNLYDRLQLEYVIDFVDVSLYFTRWPAFNVADAAIVVGVGLMMLDLRAEPASSDGSDAPGTA